MTTGIWPDKLASSNQEDYLVKTNEEPTPSFMRALITDQIIEEEDANQYQNNHYQQRNGSLSPINEEQYKFEFNKKKMSNQSLNVSQSPNKPSIRGSKLHKYQNNISIFDDSNHKESSLDNILVCSQPTQMHDTSEFSLPDISSSAQHIQESGSKSQLKLNASQNMNGNSSNKKSHQLSANNNIAKKFNVKLSNSKNSIKIPTNIYDQYFKQGNLSKERQKILQKSSERKNIY
eukprot:403348158